MVQVFVHSVLQMSVMDKVLSGFVDNFMQDKEADVGKDWQPSSGAAVVDEVRQFMDHLQTFLLDCFFEDCKDIHSHFARKSLSSDAPMTSLTTLSSTKSCDHRKLNAGRLAERRTERSPAADTLQFMNDDEVRNAVSAAVRRQVEVEIYIPCSSRVTFVLEKAFSRPEKHLAHITACIAPQPQSFFGIPVRHISPSSWDGAVCNMRELRTRALPIDRIDCLLQVAKDIPRIHQEEQSLCSGGGALQKPLGADDILPVFIYVLVKAQIPNVMALNQELQALCDPDRR